MRTRRGPQKASHGQGGSRRGFLHVLEILVVVLVVFALFVQFSILPPLKNDWSTARLQLLSQDALRTLDLQGINWFDPVAVDAGVGGILNSSSIRYDVRVLHAPPLSLRVGCYYCSSAQLDNLGRALASVRVNGENVSATVENATSFQGEYDVTVTHALPLSGVRSELEAYLRSGKGVVELRDISSSGEVDAVQTDLFGLLWNGSLAPDDSMPFFPASRNESAHSLGAGFWRLPAYQATFDQQKADEWTVDAGSWTVLASKVWSTDATAWNRASAGLDLGNYTASVNVTLERNYTTANDSWAGIGVRSSGGERYLLIMAWDGSVTLQNATGESLRKLADVLGPGGVNATRGVRLDLRANGSNISAFVNGSLIDWASNSRLVGGGVSLEANRAAALFDNVQQRYVEWPVTNAIGSGEKVIARTNAIAALKQGTNATGMVALDGAVAGHGRTVWVSDGPEHVVRQLLKAAVLWAAGDEAPVVLGSIGNEFATARYPKLLTEDYPQMVEVQLRTSTIY